MNFSPTAENFYPIFCTPPIVSTRNNKMLFNYP